jgi:hypothetical protein
MSSVFGRNINLLRLVELQRQVFSLFGASVTFARFALAHDVSFESKNSTISAAAAGITYEPSSEATVAVLNSCEIFVGDFEIAFKD